MPQSRERRGHCGLFYDLCGKVTVLLHSSKDLCVCLQLHCLPVFSFTVLGWYYGNGNENVTWKYNFISFVLLRDFFNSLDFFRNGELSRNQLDRSGVQVKKENEKFTVVCWQNLECGHFTLLFWRGQQRNVPKCKTHVQSDCFCSLNLLFCDVVVAVAVVAVLAPYLHVEYDYENEIWLQFFSEVLRRDKSQETSFHSLWATNLTKLFWMMIA